MRARTTVMLAAAALVVGIGVGVTWASAGEDDGTVPTSPAEIDRDGPPTSRPSASSSTSTSTALSRPESLAHEACATPYRAQQVGLDRRAALIHESPDDESARLHAAQVETARLAVEAGRLDPEFVDFAAAHSYWRDHASVEAGDPPDPRLDAAIATVSDVCGEVGVPDGDEFIEIPYDQLNADTAERGRFDACEDLIFGRDGAVFVEGERFTYEDCDLMTEPALAETDHDDAYRAAVSLFLAETGGFVCWGQECRDESDFSPY